MGLFARLERFFKRQRLKKIQRELEQIVRIKTEELNQRKVVLAKIDEELETASCDQDKLFLHANRLFCLSSISMKKMVLDEAMGAIDAISCKLQE